MAVIELLSVRVRYLNWKKGTQMQLHSDFNGDGYVSPILFQHIFFSSLIPGSFILHLFAIHIAAYRMPRQMNALHAINARKKNERKKELHEMHAILN